MPLKSTKFYREVPCRTIEKILGNPLNTKDTKCTNFKTLS